MQGLLGMAEGTYVRNRIKRKLIEIAAEGTLINFVDDEVDDEVNWDAIIDVVLDEIATIKIEIKKVDYVRFVDEIIAVIKVHPAISPIHKQVMITRLEKLPSKTELVEARLALDAKR